MQNDPLPTSSPLLLHSSPPPSDSEEDMADDENEDSEWDSACDSDPEPLMGMGRSELWCDALSPLLDCL